MEWKGGASLAMMPSVDSATGEEPQVVTWQPRRLGRYTLLAPLSEGGMARVYVAQRDGTHEISVLKLMLASLEANEVAVKRFHREANVASHLLHPKIARVLDAGVAEEGFYIAMEFVAGMDLEAMSYAMLANKRLLPYPVALTAILDVLEGLDYAHHALDASGQPLGVVHRDLSPRNMMMTFKGEAKVIDFGLVRGNVDDFKTAGGMILGTLRFISPEQALAMPVDARSDVYSVAIVLYELLTGTLLVSPGKPMEVVRQIVSLQPRPANEVNPGLSPELAAVVAKGFAKTPSERWSSAAEFAAALREAGKPLLADCTREQIAAFLGEQFADQAQRARMFVELGVERHRASLGPEGLPGAEARTRTVLRAQLEAELTRAASAGSAREQSDIEALTEKTGLIFPHLPEPAHAAGLVTGGVASRGVQTSEIDLRGRVGSSDRGMPPRATRIPQRSTAVVAVMSALVGGAFVSLLWAISTWRASTERTDAPVHVSAATNPPPTAARPATVEHSGAPAPGALPAERPDPPEPSLVSPAPQGRTKHRVPSPPNEPAKRPPGEADARREAAAPNRERSAPSESDALGRASRLVRTIQDECQVDCADDVTAHEQYAALLRELSQLPDPSGDVGAATGLLQIRPTPLAKFRAVTRDLLKAARQANAPSGATRP